MNLTIRKNAVCKSVRYVNGICMPASISIEESEDRIKEMNVHGMNVFSIDAVPLVYPELKEYVKVLEQMPIGGQAKRMKPFPLKIIRLTKRSVDLQPFDPSEEEH